MHTDAKITYVKHVTVDGETSASAEDRPLFVSVDSFPYATEFNPVMGFPVNGYSLAPESYGITVHDNTNESPVYVIPWHRVYTFEPSTEVPDE